ncbi:hypothetical protein [Salinispora arenicola]|uniref:hypothetical protein n=1 Tax=Salinispora arenicola TaxID=168697 RepID=UPI00169B360B|nr:hypothetical protein [Salinispora arenicola]NIL64702.1 hypothetical protein [Salinispora arenicola]
MQAGAELLCLHGEGDTLVFGPACYLVGMGLHGVAQPPRDEIAVGGSGLVRRLNFEDDDSGGAPFVHQVEGVFAEPLG